MPVANMSCLFRDTGQPRSHRLPQGGQELRSLLLLLQECKELQLVSSVTRNPTSSSRQP